MSDQANQKASNDLVDECVAGRRSQTLDNQSSTDIDVEGPSPWKYPSFNSKKKGTGSGKLEKAEILELTVEYLKSLQVATNSTENVSVTNTNAEGPKVPDKEQNTCSSRELQAYSKGYSDCTSEVLRFLVTVEATDPRLPCFQRLMAHLRIQCRHLIDLPDHDNKQRNKQNTSTSNKTTQIGKKTNFKTEAPGDGPSGKRQRIDVDSTNGSEKPKNLTVMGFLEESNNPAYHKGHRSVGSSSRSSSNDNSNPESMNGNNSGNNNDMNGNGNSFPSQYPNNNSMPFPNHFYPPSYGFPTYALHPAGTHYIPVALHPGIQMPSNNVNGTLPAATLINPGLGFYGSSMSGLPHPSPMGPGPSPVYGPMGAGFSMGSGLGGMGTGFGGMGSGLGGLPSGLAGPGGLPVYLSMAQKEQNRNRGQDSNGSSENESSSSSDEYNFSSSSSGNISEVGIQTEQPHDHSDYFSAGSR
ncbi:probable serine/threonine-protein kinase DDB_G0276461 isoform X2 [Actinia tenebrosa]|uniref:Probable serine/threonine-protein kinase DDB_G0276461 isoform X2 n=1 Tax=Actinia tenebrosa TaxID=6105 RepID=A0A6P8IJC4_ACTTE|nr:probable serine/threonine-protein kinase DDB_G0276461 isoform X2 [Actinia tenebrosa]